MHILVINDDGPPDPSHSPYIRTLVATLQSHSHLVSVCLPDVQRSWIGKAHLISEVITPTYYRPGPFHFLSSPQHNHSAPSHLSQGVTSPTPLASSQNGSSSSQEPSMQEPSSQQPSNQHYPSGEEEWVLINGTPAACAQIGLHHLFPHKPPIDLVLSGPNFGRNSTTIYALSSGTIGGALEAAVCGFKAIALSWAYESREHDPQTLEVAARHSVKVVESLMQHWGEDVELYNVNVPLRKDVESRQVLFTRCLRNRWEGVSAFREVLGEDEAEVEKVRSEEGMQNGGLDMSSKGDAGLRHRRFEWAPSHKVIRLGVAQSHGGNDGLVISEGYTSITPMVAAFMEAKSHPIGELKIPSTLPTQANTSTATLPDRTTPVFQAHVSYHSPYVQPLIFSSLKALSRSSPCILRSEPPDLSSLSKSSLPYLHITSYESIHHSLLLSSPKTYFANSYIYRKALIRKHHLPNTVAHYTAKQPEDILKAHVPLTLELEIDYAEFLDEALVEAWELKEAWARNEDKSPINREWWILKPAMSDGGRGIRLFSSEDELREIFEAWEEDESEEEEDDDDDKPEDSHNDENKDEERLQEPMEEGQKHQSLSDGLPLPSKGPETDGILTSHLRHFVVQPYIPPLLVPACNNRKFHIRSYVLALGALKVYVYQEMLALFAAEPYTPPGETEAAEAEATETEPTTEKTSSLPSTKSKPPPEDAKPATPIINMAPHLTNTCQQPPPTLSLPPSAASPNQAPVQLLSTLPFPNPTTHAALLDTISACTASLFKAAAQQPTHFQPLPNAFEVFGVDWLPDRAGKPWLLEVNAFPDFAMSGEVGREVVEGVWRGVVRRVGREMFGLEEADEGDRWREVLDLDMGRGR